MLILRAIKLTFELELGRSSYKNEKNARVIAISEVYKL